MEILGMKSKIIGITGSIATGKSTVISILKKLGYKIIDADKVAHFLMLRGNENYEKLVKFFGNSILGDDLEIDRKKLGDLVFSDKSKLDLLNKLTHPTIFNTIYKEIKSDNEKIVFVELPLLFELLNTGNLGIEIDEKWLVYVNEDTQIQRLMNRNSFTFEEAFDRVKSQMNIEEKRKLADFIIENNKDMAYLEEQILNKLGEK